MNTNQFSLANRKQLADLLADKYDSLRSKTKQNFRRKEQELETALINEYAEKRGVLKLQKQIAEAQEEIHDLQMRIQELGFDYRHGHLFLNDLDTNPLVKIVKERIVKQLGKADDIDARFDSTMVAMMTVATLADAEKLMKSVTGL